MTMHGRSREIDRFVERVRDHWQVPGVAIAVVNEGVPIYVQAYGVASLADGTSADPHGVSNRVLLESVHRFYCGGAG